MDGKLRIFETYDTEKANKAFEIKMQLRVKEMEKCMEEIAEGAKKGNSYCFLKVGDGMICKDNLLELVNGYKFDILLTIHDKYTTFVKCYFGDSCNGNITIDLYGNNNNITNVDVDDLYENMDKYVWNSTLIKEMNKRTES